MPMPKLLLLSLLVPAVAFADHDEDRGNRGPSFRKLIAEATDRLERALEDTRDSHPGCRNRVEPGLKQAIDALDALGPNSPPGQLDNLVGLVTQVKNSTFRCDDDVMREISRSIGDLRDAQDWLSARRAPPAAPVVFGGAEITEPGLPGPVISIPFVTLTGMTGQSVYLGVHWRGENGAWSPWQTFPAIQVANAQYTWANPYRQRIEYGELRNADTGSGRFVVHAGVFDNNGREIAGLDMPFQAHYPHMQQVMVQPPPPPPPQGNVPPPPPPSRDCGTGLDDPGCGTTRSGGWAMDRPTWDGFMRSMRDTISEMAKRDMCRDVFSNRYLTARQLSMVMDLFISEYDKLEVAKFAAPHVVDPGNAFGLSTKFLSTQKKRDFMALMSAQR